MTARVSMRVFVVRAHLRVRFGTASFTRGCPQTMYGSIYYLVVSGSEAAIRLPVRKSVSADLITSRASPVVKDGCRLSYFSSRLDVAC